MVHFFCMASRVCIFVSVAALLRPSDGAAIIHPDGTLSGIQLGVGTQNPRRSQSAFMEPWKKTASGRWLFGSLTCPLDVLPVDQMLPHQLRQSSERPFDHRVLYVSSGEQRGEVRSQLERNHAEMLRNLQSNHQVDEMARLDDINDVSFMELALKFMASGTAEAFTHSRPYDRDYNKAMVSFLAKCMDGYDHCAWLDGDIFVHKGTQPWVDEAVQVALKDSEVFVGRPSFRPSEEDHPSLFSSRYFIYHTAGMRKHHLLPLQGRGFNTWEEMINANHDRPDADSTARSFYSTGHTSGSWVIHPPESALGLRHLLQACTHHKRDGVTALLAIVQKGSESGESAYLWRQNGGGANMENMDLKAWISHVKSHCGGHPFVKSLLQQTKLKM